MKLRLPLDLLRVRRATEGFELVLALRVLEPSLDQGRVHFEVELQPVGEVPEPERLIAAARRACQVDRSLGLRERVRVPLKNG